MLKSRVHQFGGLEFGVSGGVGCKDVGGLGSRIRGVGKGGFGVLYGIPAGFKDFGARGFPGLMPGVEDVGPSLLNLRLSLPAAS